MKTPLAFIADILGRKKRKYRLDEPVIWTGDLDDDCIAIWNGLALRAEWMDKKKWWWAVSTRGSAEEEIDSSNNYPEKCIDGRKARKCAEEAARKYIERKTGLTIN